MTTRPLMTRTIGELEMIFIGGKNDRKILGGLEAELMHRNVPRARALLDRVQLAQKRLADGPKHTSDRDLVDLAEDPLADAHAAKPIARGDAEAAAGSKQGDRPTPPKVQPPATPARQPGLQLSHPSSSVTTGAPQPHPASSAIQPTAAPTRPAVPPAATMSRVEALAVLKVPATARWEAIEMARREIVDRARPDRLERVDATRRRAVQDEASAANEAYRSLIASPA